MTGANLCQFYFSFCGHGKGIERIKHQRRTGDGCVSYKCSSFHNSIVLVYEFI
jgi:hypothetical protein